ncbi:Hypothetical protein A7982_03569 [Minicystis rosea]|nr:Hypothetical protein A7982_03569 [Minicystis rosea]
MAAVAEPSLGPSACAGIAAPIAAAASDAEAHRRKVEAPIIVGRA